ncbi:diguanylate cyclase domain-containing protein [Paenibacillus hodogayensis]|uniref:Diguanylate cyclase domain-containing protein n=1 Tax=Paenibacillus hodogayensis TaxID=279208 RepID=A0ABV5VZ01_9BACL
MEQTVHGTHDLFLVAVSFLIALMASYTAVDFARRTALSKGWERRIWRLGSASAMGIGMWVLHFIAMLAYRLPLVVDYDLRTVWLSLLVATVGSLCALLVAGTRSASLLRMLSGGIVAGTSFLAMHLLGLSAMSGVAFTHAPEALQASALVAMAGLTSSLLLTFGSIRRVTRFRRGLRSFLSAFVMTLSVSGMHYGAMAGSHISPLDPGLVDEALARSAGLPTGMAVSIALGTIGVLGMAQLGASHADRRLARQVATNGSILESAIDCILMFDHRETIIEFNPAAERTFGYKRPDMLGKPLARVIDLQTLRSRQRDPKAAGQPPGEPYADIVGSRLTATARHAEGHPIPVELAITRIRTDGASLYTAYLRDITERERAERLIWRMAYTDMLTDLPNRNGFNETGAKALVEARTNGKPLAILFVDLDRFKLVNDTLGHRVGDLLLQAVAERLKAQLAEADMLSRLGGDEFVLLRGAGPDEAAATAGRMLEFKAPRELF